MYAYYKVKYVSCPHPSYSKKGGKKEINIKLGWEIGWEGVRILTKSGNNDTITIGIISYQLFTQECIR